MSNNINTDYTLENIYRDNIARLKGLFNIYRDIYKLPEYVHDDKEVNPDAFEYAKKRKYFVILVLHTKEGYVCFQRSFDTGHLSLNLPGASISLEKEDTIITAINRVARESFKDARIADIAPIISIKNRFHSKNGDVFEHFGLGIRALLLNDIQDIKNISSGLLYKGKFSRKFPINEIPHPPAKETYKVFREWFKKKKYTTYTNEIETQHEVIQRYVFHQKFINPCIKCLSHVFGDKSVKDVKKETFKKIGKVDKAIDIACGDDKTIFDFLTHAKLFVANDISVDQIKNLNNQYSSRYNKLPKSSILIFTNHDCLDLPFREKAFDVAICRNLLHHMNTADDLEELLKNLKRIANKVIIIEIQDPNKENILGRIRHKYYMKYLKDEGKNFYAIDDFEQIVRKKFADNEINFEYLSTIRGVYMFAEIDKCD